MIAFEHIELSQLTRQNNTFFTSIWVQKVFNCILWVSVLIDKIPGLFQVLCQSVMVYWSNVTLQI